MQGALDMVALLRINHNTLEVETGGFEVQSPPCLRSELEASLGY